MTTRTRCPRKLTGTEAEILSVLKEGRVEDALDQKDAVLGKRKLAAIKALVRKGLARQEAFDCGGETMLRWTLAS